MAENVVAAVLGGESEPLPESGEASTSLAGLDSAAAAIAVNAAKSNRTLADKAGIYFDKQGRLVELQVEHLHEQREAMLANKKLRRYRERIKIGVQFFFALIFTCIGLGLAMMVYDAATSHSVVVEPFDTPAALAARGITGKAVASDVLDALRKMEAATRTANKGLTAVSAWSSDIKIEVPETGVSIGEIGRLLHERLGHDLHIDGELEQTEGGGLALTVRGDDVPSATFVGGAGDVRKLTLQAAEYLYGRSQPVRYAAYLSDQEDRNDDARAFIPGALAQATDDDERAELADTWGAVYNSLNEPTVAIEKYRLERLFDRSKWTAWHHIIYDMLLVEGEEATWREGKAYLAAADKASANDKPPLRHFANPAQVTWDFPLLLHANLDETKLNNGAGVSAFPIGVYLAESYTLTHDPASAERALVSSDPQLASTKDEALMLQAFDALDRGDPATAITPLEKYWTAWQEEPAQAFNFPDYPCYLGLAYGLAGRVEKAEELFKRLGPWSRCYAFHGDLLAHANDLAGAERIWAEGLKIAPDLPIIYLHRGLSELSRGEIDRARSDFTTANAKAPHWADPLKAWGDLLVGEGKREEALAKYDEALEYAQAWKELHEAKETAMSKK